MTFTNPAAAHLKDMAQAYFENTDWCQNKHLRWIIEKFKESLPYFDGRITFDEQEQIALAIEEELGIENSGI
jgi:hypothetical protein